MGPNSWTPVLTEKLAKWNGQYTLSSNNIPASNGNPKCEHLAPTA